jgi:tetratricopeptide (TPR) repeat protein
MLLFFYISTQILVGISQESSKSFRITTELFKEGEYQEARELYNSLLKELDEYRGEALFRIGECDYNLGEYDKAIKTFQKVWHEYRDSYLAPEALYGMILSYIAGENWDKADDMLYKLISVYPGYKSAQKTLLAEAIILFKHGQYNEVTTILEDIDTKEALFYKAKSYFSLGEPMRALATLKKLIEEYPETSLARYAHYYMGDVLFFSGDFEGALYKYIVFLEKYPYSNLKDYAKYKLAVCCFNKGDYMGAMVQLRPLLNSSDKYLAAHSNLLFGESLMETGSYDKALKSLTRVKSNFSDLRAGALSDLKMGEVFLKKKDTLQARILYQQMASRYTSGDFAGFGEYLAGAQLFSEYDFNEAKNYFTQILEHYWGSGFHCPATAMLIRTYNQMGDYELSIALGSRLIKEMDCKRDKIWKGRAMFHLAEAYYIKSRYNKAKLLYKEIIDGFSDPLLIAPSLSAYGWCLLHEDRYNEAERQFKRVIASYWRDTTSLINSLFGEGVVLYNRGEYEDALDEFEGIPSIEEGSQSAPRAIFYAGKCYYNLEYYRQAIESWEKILSKYHNSKIAANAAYQIGQTYFQALKYDQAVAYFKLVLKEYPTSAIVPRSLIALGNSYYNGEDYSQAVREFSKFIQLYQGDTLIPQVKSSLSRAYYMLGQEDKIAMREFIEKFKGDPNAALAQFNLGIDSYDKGNYEEAIKEFKKTVVDFPETEYAEKAGINILKSYEELENYEKLKEEAEQFQIYFPNSKRKPLALFYKGIGFYHLMDYKSASLAFKELVGEYPESDYASSAQYNLSQCYKQIGETEKAASELKTYAGKENSFKTQILSGVTYQENGDFKDALDIYQGITPGNPEQKAELYSRKGKCLREIGKTDEAIAEYRKLMPLDLMDNGYQIEGLAELGALFEKEGKVKDAIKSYSRLLEVTTDDGIISTVKKRVNYLRGKK